MAMLEQVPDVSAWPSSMRPPRRGPSRSVTAKSIPRPARPRSGAFSPGQVSCDSNGLRLAFTRTQTRTQRKSDGTLVIDGRRFEVPDRYRHLTRLEVRYASWDLSLVHLVIWLMRANFCGATEVV
jgi:hypothetical protein